MFGGSNDLKRSLFVGESQHFIHGKVERIDFEMICFQNLGKGSAER